MVHGLATPLHAAAVVCICTSDRRQEVGLPAVLLLSQGVQQVA